ncbi:MAG TPA: hypothetical protein VFG23_04845 [Polyangia bacterium]|nr:hypothetical protein [Polyangia bacterium]
MAGKVTGPGNGPSGGGPIGGTDESRPNVGGPRFADKLGQTQPAAQASQPAAASLPPGGPTSDLAADLRAGKITPRAAVDRVIDRVVDKQLGVGAPAATREKLRAALENAVADDPLLADKIRGLG